VKSVTVKTATFARPNYKAVGTSVKGLVSNLFIGLRKVESCGCDHRRRRRHHHHCHLPVFVFICNLLLGVLTGAFAKLQKATISFFMSVSPSASVCVCVCVRIEHLDSHWTFFHEI
jgi:hypothetical protein